MFYRQVQLTFLFAPWLIEKIPGKVQKNSSRFQIQPEKEYGDFSISVKINENELTFSMENKTETIKILSISEKKMKNEIDEEEIAVNF